jgi:hypothetical protein
MDLAAKPTRLVEGSKGQQVLNPLAAYLSELGGASPQPRPNSA